MADFSANRPLRSGRPFWERMSGVVFDFTSVALRWNAARVTRRSLSKLTDRELDDIGLVRGDIDRIARRG